MLIALHFLMTNENFIVIYSLALCNIVRAYLNFILNILHIRQQVLISMQRVF